MAKRAAAEAADECRSLLSLEEARSLLAGEERVRSILSRLLNAPPQVLLIEGGTPSARLAVAQFWACVLNCHQSSLKGPCLECSVCGQMLQRAHRDMFFFDGSAASIKIDEVRELRRVLGEPPREAQYRLAIFHEAQALGIEAANALLKSLEEPRPSTRFVLSAPQRERLLPTLVSRSWTITLSWGDPVTRKEDEGVAEWLTALAGAARDGRGWMSRTQGRGAADRNMAQQVFLGCQRAVLKGTLRQQGALQDPPAPLEAFMADCLDPVRLRRLDEALAQGAMALDYGANPTLCLDWLAVTLYRIAH